MFDPNLVAWVRRLKQSGMLQRSSSFLYVVFTGSLSMRTIVRTQTELFTTTAGRQAASFDVIVNGNYFDVGSSTKFQALVGSQPAVLWKPL